MRRMLAWAGRLACVALMVFVAYVNYDAIVGAYGDGPPYYGRSANMDKWENPVPTLIAVDVLTLVIVLALWRWCAKTLR